MGILIMAAQLIASLSILVFIHELGHFLAAKAFGMRVDKFFIFFDAWGSKLWSKKIGETEYGIGWLPLGGYVKIAGMIDESMDKEQMAKEPEEWEFRSKPAWQRFIVMIGGIVMNVILGVIVFAACLSHYEKDYIPVAEMDKGIYAFQLGEELGFKTGDKIISINGEEPIRFKDIQSPKIYFGAEIDVERDGKRTKIEVTDTLFKKLEKERGASIIEPFNHQVKVARVIDDGHAKEAGLEVKDIIVAVNGTKVRNYGDLTNTLEANKNGSVSLTVERDGKNLNLTSKVSEEGKLGFNPYFDAKAVNTTKTYSFGETIKYGSKEGWDMVAMNAVAIGKMFTGDVNPIDSVQSPIGIARVFGDVWIWEKFWKLTGLLSFILAFMNILPIPALDGGHMMFLTFEMLTGRSLSDNFLEKAQMVGMMILLPLMLFAIGKDIWVGVMSLFN